MLQFNPNDSGDTPYKLRRAVNPPAPIFDALLYPIRQNAQMAKQHGLSWIVSTDHGGRLHDSAASRVDEDKLTVPCRTIDESRRRRR